MTSQAAIHKRNLESSILFMQQEHAGTLKALHEEIQKLQKKCSGEVVKAYHISSAIRWGFYAPNFGEVEGAYWFGPVHPSVSP